MVVATPPIGHQSSSGDVPERRTAMVYYGHRN
jgi:hypothetical protein